MPSADRGSIATTRRGGFRIRTEAPDGVAGLEESYAACGRIMRANASTFSLACRLLPAQRRRATYALYGLFRTLDDLVDEAGVGAIDRATALTALRRWRAWLAAPATA